jgi:hypothetical protein
MSWQIGFQGRALRACGVFVANFRGGDKVLPMDSVGF